MGSLGAGEAAALGGTALDGVAPVGGLHALAGIETLGDLDLALPLK